jgi:hypothetical protein
MLAAAATLLARGYPLDTLEAFTSYECDEGRPHIHVEAVTKMGNVVTSIVERPLK